MIQLSSLHCVYFLAHQACILNNPHWWQKRMLPNHRHRGICLCSTMQKSCRVLLATQLLYSTPLAYPLIPVLQTQFVFTQIQYPLKTQVIMPVTTRAHGIKMRCIDFDLGLNTMRYYNLFQAKNLLNNITGKLQNFSAIS